MDSNGGDRAAVLAPAHIDRARAALVDLVFTAVVWGTTAAALSTQFSLSIVVVLGVGALVHGYVHGVFTWLTGGQTFGKAVFGLSVREATGTPLAHTGRTAARLIGRYSVGYLLTDVLLVGTVWSLRDPDRRCPHDLLFGTQVVQRVDVRSSSRKARLSAFERDRQSGLALVKESWPLVTLLRWSMAVAAAVTNVIVWVGAKAGLLNPAGGTPAGHGAGAHENAALGGDAAGGAKVVAAGLTIMTGVAVGAAALSSANGTGLREPFRVVAAADGHVAVVFENSEPLVVAPLEPGASASAGPSVPGPGAAAATGGQVAVAGIDEVHLGPIGEELVEVQLPDVYQYSGVDVSPDGTMLALQTDAGALLVTPGSGTQRRVDVTTDSNDRAFGPAFSPDGQSLLITVDEWDSDARRFVVVDVASGATKTWPGPAGQDSGPPVWSPDSRRLAYITPTVAVRNNVLTVLDVQTGDTTEVEIGGLAGGPTWSPEGDRIAYDDSTGGPWFLCVLTLADAGVTCIDSVPNAREVTWSWSDDLLVASVGRCGFDVCRDENIGVWGIDPDDGAAFQILRVAPASY